MRSYSRALLWTSRLVLVSVLALTISAAQDQASQTNSSSLPAAPTPAAPAPAPAPASTSTATGLPDYSKPRSHIFNVIAPYSPRHVAPPSFTNSSRIDQVFRNGTMYLSMNDAVALALENNLDLAIARYNLSIADTDILRTKAGASFRGVNTGLVQGTPGGGVGGFGSGASGPGAGGTTTAAGGAATGAGGIVISTLGGGPTTPIYDPFLSGTVQFERATTPQASILAGAEQLTQNNTLANFTYNQGFATGTTMAVGFNNSRVTTNSLFNSLSPQLGSNFRLTVTQHLLQGLGWGVNTRSIKIAKNNREISDVAFRQQVIATVVQIQNIYWDLVNAYEDVKVKERSLALAEKTLADNRKQVEIGTLAPIEIVRAESDAATRTQDLIVSQTNLQLQQLLMKNAISRNLTDNVLASSPVIPTDTMTEPGQEPVLPTEELISDALSHRPELAQARIDLTNRALNNKGLRSGLLPSLDLYAFYGGAGLGGDQSAIATCSPANTNSFCTPPGSFPSRSYGDTFSSLFDTSAPDRGLGFNLTIPIRNRAAQADQVRGELEFRQAQMRLQQLENQIRIDVRNSQFVLQQNRARVEAALKGVAFGRENLDAEQKKYALGASTNTLVLQAQRDLAQAESTLVAARAAYEKSRVDLDRAIGLTLPHMGIEMADAETGHVEKSPQVPGVIHAEPAQPSVPPATQTPPQSEPQTQPK
ncbi:MAG TPA: TolC family protein [Terriglobales bacterium]|nr:TolC family protein [Terriglobales bacterium]